VCPSPSVMLAYSPYAVSPKHMLFSEGLRDKER
jgi:hypothetical protein